MKLQSIRPIVLASLLACASEGPEPEPQEQRTVSEQTSALVGANTSVVISVPTNMRTAPFNVERRLTVPPGFSAAVYARVPGARFLALAPDGRLLVSVPSSNKIVAVSTAGAVADLLTGLARPHDMVFHTITGTTYLYVAEKNQIRRYVWSGGPTNGQVVISGLPDASLPELGGSYGHELKNIALDGNNRLFVSIASASNADPADLAATPKRGAIYVYNADGTGGRLYAQGIRNAEGLAIAPGGTDLWVVVNNRDNIAYPFHQDWDGDGTDDYGKVMQSYVDNHPPEEFIRVRDGGNYGWPFCNPNPDAGLVNMPFDRDVQNNADGTRLNCATADRVNRGIQAHSAPLGVSFVPNAGSALPADFSGSAVSAYHGCWNCSTPVGYKVSIFPFASGLPTQELDLATGFRGFGRPVDVVVNSAGSIFISDDSAGAIYRLSYVAPAGQAISKVVLINASTQQPVPGFDPFPNNAVIDLGQLGAGPYALRAYTAPATVGSVRFALDGATLQRSRRRRHSRHASQPELHGHHGRHTRVHNARRKRNRVAQLPSRQLAAQRSVRQLRNARWQLRRLYDQHLQRQHIAQCGRERLLEPRLVQPASHELGVWGSLRGHTQAAVRAGDLRTVNLAEGQLPG
jgi:glucose/arabinose dehydrogenase